MSADRHQHHNGHLCQWLRGLLAVTIAIAAGSCAVDQRAAGVEEADGPIGVGVSLLTAAERRARAAQIRDAAFASGMTQGYLLAGIADAETNMSHCWSELTWACQGPASADCGGGPVVAGAGDGPCEDLQGGLGMFQFDAGTHADTLAREGDRILSIAGNVQAAVDFVVSMLIRSVYVDGVDDAAQAIAWSNGVRPDNERWDPWISTVTHYYNGCTPSASCWSSRYPYYADKTRAVFAEMGAEFWEVEQDFAAEYVHQSFPLAADPFELAAGEEVAGYIDLRNVGTEAWTPGATFLGTTEPRDGASPLAASDWVAPHRAATVDHATAAGDTGRFAFTVRAPDEPGDYAQFFDLVQENVAWFGDRGGPPDDQLQVRVTVVAGAAPGSDAAVRDAATGAEPGDAGPSGEDDGPASGGEQPPDDSECCDASARADGGDRDAGDGGSRAGIFTGSDGGCSAARGPRSPWTAVVLAALGVCLLARRRRRF